VDCAAGDFFYLHQSSSPIFGIETSFAFQACSGCGVLSRLSFGSVVADDRSRSRKIINL